MKVYLLAAVAALCATASYAQPGPGDRRPNPDADGDGKVTLAEFKAAESVRQSRMFTRMDTNNDGEIGAEEAKVMAQRGDAKGRDGGGLMQLDANKDGSVSREELSATSQRRFDRADTNKDGWLSPEEMDMMHQAMRGPGPK